jgi:hypothetical protein
MTKKKKEVVHYAGPFGAYDVGERLAFLVEGEWVYGTVEDHSEDSPCGKYEIVDRRVKMDKKCKEVI